MCAGKATSECERNLRVLYERVSIGQNIREKAENCKVWLFLFLVFRLTENLVCLCGEKNEGYFQEKNFSTEKKCTEKSQRKSVSNDSVKNFVIRKVQHLPTETDRSQWKFHLFSVLHRYRIRKKKVFSQKKFFHFSRDFPSILSVWVSVTRIHIRCRWKINFSRKWGLLQCHKIRD